MSTAAIDSHRGDAYQVNIAIHYLIRLLSESEIEWVQIESVVLPNQDECVEVDDIVVKFNNDTYEFIQAKKNQTNHKNWSITEQELKKELLKAFQQWDKNPKNSKVIFYSQTPFGELAKLIEKAPYYDNYNAFESNASSSLKKPLEKLANIINREEEEIYSFCSYIEIGPHHSLEDWPRVNQEKLKYIVPYADRALSILKELVEKQQIRSKNSIDKFYYTRNDIEQALAAEGLVRTPYRSEADILNTFKQASQIGRYDISREILGEKLERPELTQLLHELENGYNSILLTDGPGSGKTWLLLELIERIEHEKPNWGLLLIKGDYFDEVTSETDLSEKGLPKDIIGQVARLSEYRQVIVILDSLDVLSLSRDHKALQVFLSLIDRLVILPQVTVIAACRSFDLTYHPLLRERKWDKKYPLPGFDFNKTVAPLLEKNNVEVEKLPNELKELLTQPQNLKLFSFLINKKVNFESLTSIYQLRETFLNELVVKKPKLGQKAVEKLQEIAIKLMKKRKLRLSKLSAQLNEFEHGLFSLDILQEINSGQITFFHQTWLDTLVVREALSREETLETFIGAHPPMPFIRPSIRAFLFYLRVHEPDSFAKQIRQVLQNQSIAYHIRRLIVESLTEINPVESDKKLFLWLFREHSELFRRFFQQIPATAAWFDFLASESGLFKILFTDSNDDSRFQLILKLEIWMNSKPDEIIPYWQKVLKENNKQLARVIDSSLHHFKHWNIDKIEQVLERLVDILGNSGNFLGGSISRYVMENNKGDKLLWRYITSTVRPEEGADDLKNNFHNKDFLKDRLYQSECLATWVIDALEQWSRDSKYFRKDLKLRDLFLKETSWRYTHEKLTMYHGTSVTELLSALEQSLIAHAERCDTWWEKIEAKLRNAGEAALLYLLIEAYKKTDIEQNSSKIEQFLQREEIYYCKLDYELSQLINLVSPYISQTTHNFIQEKILSKLAKTIEIFGDKIWLYERAYKRLFFIPIRYRMPETQQFLDKQMLCLGTTPPIPEIYSAGGTPEPPVTIETLFSLSDNNIITLLKYYHQKFERVSLRESLIGGTESFIPLFSTCCSIDPRRFFKFLKVILFEDIYEAYAIAIIEGVSNHLNYRFGRLRPPKDWKPIEPLANGTELAEQLLHHLERYPDCWGDGFAMTRALQACSEVINESEEINSIIFLLFRLLKHPDPTPQKEERNDLTFTALNSVRGAAAEAAITLANRLLQQQQPLAELLFPLLLHFALDPHPAVRVPLLQQLSLLTYYEHEFGWNIFEIIFRAPQHHLWLHGEKFLYYQYKVDFKKVYFYLGRLKHEASTVAGQTWGRIATLAYLKGYISEHDLFHDLITDEALKGITQVFAANVNNTQYRHICEKGLLRILQQTDLVNIDILKTISRLLKENKENITIAEAFLNAFKRNDSDSILYPFYNFFDWLAYYSNQEPLAALDLYEILLDKLESLDLNAIAHEKSLIDAAIQILREADDSDDEALINRAIKLQDRLLKLNLSGMNTFLANLREI